MPKTFRAMKKADDGKPQVGDKFGCLGVRVPKDISANDEGVVDTGDKGMSVAADGFAIDPAFISMDYIPVFPSASGKKSERLWYMGEGKFEESEVSDGLVLRLKTHNNRTGLVVPSRKMKIEDFQNRLGATRDSWKEVPCS